MLITPKKSVITTEILESCSELYHFSLMIPQRSCCKSEFATALWTDKTSGFSKRKILTFLLFQCNRLNCWWKGLRSIHKMNHDSTAQFGFKPSGFGGHNIASVGYAHHLIHCHGIESKGGLHLSAVYSALKFGKSAQSSHEVDALGTAQIGNA